MSPATIQHAALYPTSFSTLFWSEVRKSWPYYNVPLPRCSSIYIPSPPAPYVSLIRMLSHLIGTVRLCMFYAQACWSWLVTTWWNWKMATLIQTLIESTKILSIKGFHLEQKRPCSQLWLPGEECTCARYAWHLKLPYKPWHCMFNAVQYWCCKYVIFINETECNATSSTGHVFITELLDLTVQRRNFVTSIHAAEKQIK